MGCPRADQLPGSAIYKKRTWRRDRETSLAPVTLGELRKSNNPWVWLFCSNTDCGRWKPIALVPFIIRWGADATVDRLKRSALCTTCGQRGAGIATRGWHDSVVGRAQWPIHFICDERGIGVDRLNSGEKRR
jgi:hypothetical protein